MKRVLSYAMTGAVFALVSFWAGLTGYWTQDRAVPVRGKAVEIIGPTYPGGRLLIRWDVVRERACSSTRQELIIDAQGTRWLIQPQTYAGPAGPLGPDSFVTQTALPPDIPEGPARLRVTLAYTCNPVHRIWPVVATSPEVDFEITARPPSP